jgi:DNA-binding CsgD family transcriptional regulator
LTTALGVMDRFDDADVVFAAYRQEAEQFGASWALEFCQRCVCIARMKAGRLDDAAIEADADLDLIDALDMWHDSDVPLGILALVAFHRNDLEAARGYLARAREYSTEYARGVPPYLDWARSMLRSANGDPTGAVEEFCGVFDQPELRTQNLALEPALAPVLVRLAQRAGDRTRALAVTDTANELARWNPAVPAVTAAAAHCRGLQSGAVDDLVEAADAFENSPRVMARASASEDAGRALLRAGDTNRRARYLDRALELYGEAGAARDESRLRRQLRRAGVRRPVRQVGPAARPKLGWDSLTTAELRVVRLAALGLTNRQIAERLYLSSYTVGTHLKHAFEKVGVSSRVELTRVAVEREPAT